MLKSLLSPLLLLLFISSFGQHGAQVNLANQNLKALPDSIRKLEKTESIDLQNNQLTTLPKWLTELPHLHHLNLSNNPQLNVNEVFLLLSECKNLDSLTWRNSELIYIPFSINQLKKLKSLDIENNLLLHLPMISNELPIEELNISNNLIDTLPHSFYQLKHLKRLNFSFNPGVKEPYNYHILKELPLLETLEVGGSKTLPLEVSKLLQLKEIQLINLGIPNLSVFQDCKRLSSVTIINCPQLDFAESFEFFSGLNELKKLHLEDYQNFKLPFNISKLQHLQTLSFTNICFDYLPSAINQLKVRRLIFNDCAVGQESSFFDKISQIKTLKTLKILNLQCPQSEWSFSSFNQLDTLDLTNNELREIDLAASTVKTLILKGNHIDRSPFLNKKNVKNSSDFVSISAVNIGSTFRSSTLNLDPTHVANRIIYPSVGDKFEFNGIMFTVPKNAFLSAKSEVIKEDVELKVTILSSPKEIALSQVPLNSTSGLLLQTHWVIHIECKTKSEPVFINPAFPIIVQSKHINVNALESYQFLAHKNQWQKIISTANCCIRQDSSTAKSNRKPTVFKYKKEIPQAGFTVRKSKVQIRLKRNKRKNTLNFEITPEYGYRENFFQLFGSKIKGYPELKEYKKIKWKYVGDSLENDLAKIYFLSEQAKKEKLERKSTFYFYVLDIEDILLQPSEREDCYIMTIYQGTDSIQLNVLPFLALSSATKIQKWHSRKYEDYQEKLIERRQYWHKLDSLTINYLSLNDEKMEKFRRRIQSEFALITSVSKKSSSPLIVHQFAVDHTGWYAIGKTLTLQEPTFSAVELEIAGRKHYPKYVLIYHPESKQYYWQERKRVAISASGTTFVLSVVGDKIYYGKVNKEGKTVLQKL